MSAPTARPAVFRVVAWGVAVVAVAAGGSLGLERSWLDSESIAPRADRIDPTTGERVGVFLGFGLQVDTVPPGARVLVAGEEMGTSPLLTSVACRHGEDVLARAELGRQAASARTRCRKDVLVKLALVLRSGG